MNKELPLEIIQQIMIETNDILLCNELNFYYSAKKIFEKSTIDEKLKLLITYITQKNNDVFKLNFIQEFTKTYIFMGSFIKDQEIIAPCSFLDISCLLKNYELMKFFNERLNFEYDYITLALAIQNGDLEITRYIHIEQNIKFDLNHIDVASQINFEIFKYVYTNISPQDVQEFEYYIYKAMCNSIERDDILLLKFLCSNHKNILNRNDIGRDNQDVGFNLFHTSIEHQRIAILEFLFSEYKDIFNEYVVNNLDLSECIRYCNITFDMIEYLVDKLGYRLNIVDIFDIFMVGSEDMFVTFVKKYPTYYDLHVPTLMDMSLICGKYKAFCVLFSRLNEMSIDLTETFMSS